MAIKKDILANALKIRGSQSSADSIYRRLKPSLISQEQSYSENLPGHIDKNGSQTVHKRFTEPNTNGSQTVHKLDTNSSQKNEMVHKRFTEPNTNGSQTVHKRFTEPNTNGSQIDTQKNLSNLTGIQRQLILSIYQNCKTFGGKISQEMTIEHLSNLTKCNKNSIKTTIFRLKEKNFIELVEQKNGRGGWTKYKINHDLFSDILQQEKQIFNQNIALEEDKRFTNGSQTVHKRFTEPNTEPNTNLSSSSSLNRSTTITKETSKNESLPQEWLDIDISSLESIGFNFNKLTQIYQANKLSAEMVQDSIYAYAFDLEVNKVVHKSPINFIMSLLKVKGMPYDFPDNYESPRDRALREYMEKKKAQQEKKQKIKEELQKISFDEWLTSLPKEEQKEIINKYPHKIKSEDSSLWRAALYSWFAKEIWPKKEEEIEKAIPICNSSY